VFASNASSDERVSHGLRSLNRMNVRQAFCSFAVAASKAAMAPPATLTVVMAISLADPVKRIVISPMSVLLQLRCCELGDVWGWTWRAVRSDGCAGRRSNDQLRPTPPLPAEALSFPGVRQMAPDLLLNPIFDVAEALTGVSNREVGGGLQSQVEHRIIFYVPETARCNGPDGDPGPIYSAGLEREGGQPLPPPAVRGA
jgi:hypothetical protein